MAEKSCEIIPDTIWQRLARSTIRSARRSAPGILVIEPRMRMLDGSCDSSLPITTDIQAFLDFRGDEDAAFLKLVSRLKDDELARRELGRLPTPAPRNVVEHIEKHLPVDGRAIEVIVHSNRFGRYFRLRVPTSATPTYLMGMLRDTLNLKFSNVDNELGVELSYTYYLHHNGQAITLNTTLAEAGVKDGDRLELWIRVTLRDLVEDKEIGDKVFFHLYRANLSTITDELRKARKRAFSSSEIARIASQFFEHVDNEPVPHPHNNRLQRTVRWAARAEPAR